MTPGGGGGAHGLNVQQDGGFGDDGGLLGLPLGVLLDSLLPDALRLCVFLLVAAKQVEVVVLLHRGPLFGLLDRGSLRFRTKNREGHMSESSVQGVGGFTDPSIIYLIQKQ